MQAGRSESVAPLVVAAAALLLTCVFGFLSFMPGADPGVAGILQVGFFGGGIVAIGALLTYFVMSRRSPSGETRSRFDRLLEHRRAALAAVPVGLGAVVIGVMWFAARRMGDMGPGIAAPGGGAPSPFASIDTAGIAAFLGFGSLYIILAIYLAIRAERAAIRLAREEAEVNLA